MKHFEELGQFIRPLTSNLPDKVSVSDLTRHSVVALVLHPSVLQQNLSQFPVPALWATSQMALSKLQVALNFPQVLLNSSESILERHFWHSKKALSESQGRQGDKIHVWSCSVLISSRWTNLLNSSLSLPGLDTSSAEAWSHSLELSVLALATEARNEQVWTSMLHKVPQVKRVFHFKSVLSSVNLQ